MKAPQPTAFFAVGDISEPDKVRVVLFFGEGQPLGHAPLNLVLKPLNDAIAALEARIEALENP